MGAFVAALDAIKHATGATVLGVHHFGKDETKGERGSSALRAATDMALRIKKTGERITLSVDKQKDADPGEPIYLNLAPVKLPELASGDEPEPSSCIITPDPTTTTALLNDSQKGAIELLQQYTAGLRHGELVDAIMAANKCASRTAERLIQGLAAHGHIEKHND